MGELRDRYVRFDWAIKRLLRQKANFDVLEGFLSVFLGEPILIEEVLASENSLYTPGDRVYGLVVKARDSKKDPIVIDIRFMRELYYWERVLYKQRNRLKSASWLESCKQVKKIYSMIILYFPIGDGSDYLYYGSISNPFVSIHTNDRLCISDRDQEVLFESSNPVIKYILIRVNEFNQVAVTPLEEWMRYLKDGVIRPDTTAPGLAPAREKLLYYAMSDEERHAYDEHLNAVMIQNDVLTSAKAEGLVEGHAKGLEEGMEKGLAEGHAKGLEEGMEKGLVKGMEKGQDKERRKNARSMKELGIAIEIIERVKGLSREEITNL